MHALLAHANILLIKHRQQLLQDTIIDKMVDVTVTISCIGPELYLQEQISNIDETVAF